MKPTHQTHLYSGRKETGSACCGCPAHLHASDFIAPHLPHPPFPFPFRFPSPSHALSAVLSQAQNPLRILINDIRDTNSGHNLQQIRRDALEQAPHPLTPNSLHTHIPDALISRRMHGRALRLQPGPQQIKRINHTGAQRPRESADGARGEVSGWRVVFVAVEAVGVVGREGFLEVFEGGEVDGGVWEHADEAHGEAAVEGAEAIRAPHFAEGVEDEGVAMEAAGDGFALHSAVGGW